MEYNFDAKAQRDACVEWIQNWIRENGNDETKVVIGISGGKDSTVTAALLVKALGKDRVFGVMMPNGEQKDIGDSYKVVEVLDIDYAVVNIGPAYEALTSSIQSAHDNMADGPYNAAYQTNTPARIRMTTLYGIGAMLGNCRVVNTCNLSEDKMGYSTFYGDSAGDFAPLSHLTTEEVVAIGDTLDLPMELTHKAPSDGMCGKTDEDNLGFTYHEINEYIRKEIYGDNCKKIYERFLHNRFKTDIIQLPYYDPQLSDYLVEHSF